MLQQHDVDILNSIYKNSRMALDCTRQVNRKCRRQEFGDYLKRQQKHYAENVVSAKKQIEGAGAKVESVPAMQKAMAGMGIFMKTVTDKSTGNLAEIMYNGTNMGIVDIARTVNRSTSASEKTIALAERLLGEEEKYADGLRKFL